MSQAKTYYWLKLKDGFFEDDTIAYIEEQENGIVYSNFYLKLCLKAIRTEGRMMRLVGNTLIPYDVKSLARLTNVSIDTVAVAMRLFEQIGLVERLETGEIYLSQISEMIGKETDKAALMRRKRAEERLKGNNSGNNVTPALPECYTEIEKEIRDKRLETEIEKEREETAAEPPAPRPSIPYEAIKAFYNETCLSFPRCTAMSESRKKAIKARFNSGYTLEDFKKVFIKAEGSSFLKGRNDRNWTASFDWLIRDSSMAKVLDGNYDDHDTVPGPGPRPTGGGRNNTGFKTSNPFMEMLQEMEGRDQ